MVKRNEMAEGDHASGDLEVISQMLNVDSCSSSFSSSSSVFQRKFEDEEEDENEDERACHHL